jgi:uncharacterized protein (DUF2141 family)
MRRSFALVCLAIALLSPIVSTSVARGDGPRIVVEIDGLRSSRGSVRGALFASQIGWTEEGRQVALCRASIDGRRATCVLEAVPRGAYAFAFLHDEDDDGALDRDWIGLPQEGFGFSNDAAPNLGPPSYESARFVHQSGETTIAVRARYGL